MCKRNPARVEITVMWTAIAVSFQKTTSQSVKANVGLYTLLKNTPSSISNYIDPLCRFIAFVITELDKGKQREEGFVDLTSFLMILKDNMLFVINSLGIKVGRWKDFELK